MRATIADLRLRITKVRETLDINATPSIKIVQEEPSISIEEMAKNAKLKELNDMKAKLKGFKK
jgi:hypothetical protein